MNKVKKKSFYGVVFAVLAVITASLFFGIRYVQEQSSTFAKDGYILNVDPQAEAQKVSFSAGTPYRSQGKGQIAVKDVQKKDRLVDQDSFVHYTDGSVNALEDGVLLHTKDINKKGIVNHYGTQRDILLEKSSNGYRIKDDTKDIELKEVLWKISDRKYLFCAKDIQIVFGKKDIREAGDFIEVSYIDEGVFQIVTQDNVWQSVSTSLYAKTAEGTIFRLFDQVIEVNKQRFPLSKMVIHSDDNVELSALEIKNQQVPDFKVSSKNGTSGKSGSAGSEGKEGESGEDGEQGKTGTKGINGGSGTHGTQGSSGTSGNSGASGSSGEAGKSGSNGKGGTSGMNATQESSAKTGLPQFSFKSWEAGATSVKGTLLIEDENVMLSSESADIVLYEAGSGETVACVNEHGESGNFSVQGSEVSFQNDPKRPLQPDQEYRLVLRAKYEMNEQTFEREFVSRVFYTDSLGIQMQEAGTTTDGMTVAIEKREYSTAQHVELYLMSRADGADVTEETLAKSPHIGIDLEAGAQQENIEFKKEDIESIQSNTSYVIRMRITVDGKNYLSQQALNVVTLKQRPVISGNPYVFNNRQFKGFELYSGKVSDPDHAIMKQYYEIYDAQEGSDTADEIVKTLEVEPSATNRATNLYIDDVIIRPNNRYRFRVTTVYNDNEKIVELHSEMSDFFSMDATYYPALSYIAHEDETYDHLQGDLIIDKNGSAIVIDYDHPLDIVIESEGVYNKTISVTDLNMAGMTETDGQIIIPISESGLAQGRMYRFTAVGYVDLNDGKNEQRRTIGNVVATTQPLTKIRAKWTVQGNSSNAVSRTLQLEAEDDSWQDADHAYDANTLSKIVVELYSGSGSGRVFLKSIEFTDRDTDPHTSTLREEFIQKGREITEEDFGYKSSAMTASVYTLRIRGVYDYMALEGYTANIGMAKDYQNTYTVSNDEVIVTKASQPPALPEPSLTDTMVISREIRNEDAGAYGKSVDEKLDDDTIIGYEIQANYDNYARLARTIDYYVFEANDYANITKREGRNPIYDSTKGELVEDSENREWMKRFTLEIPATSSNVPIAAVFFGEGKDTTYNGKHILHAGKAVSNSSGNLQSGMGRGYQYVFAYALSYNATGAGEGDVIYPYQHPRYSEIAGTDTPPYILNSGIEKAPKAEPRFMAYPKDSRMTGAGIGIDVQMRYSDPDHTITPAKGGEKNPTQIYCTGKPAPVSSITVEAGQWQKVTFTSIMAANLEDGDILTPRISRELYNERYEADTGNQLEIFHLPIDLSKTFTKTMAAELSYRLNPKLDANMVEIQLLDPNGKGLLSGDTKRKIAGIRATFTDADADGGSKETDMVSMLLSVNDSGLAIVPTGRLEKLLKKAVEVQVELIYDTNEQGWDIGREDMFALQSITNPLSTPKLNSYLTYYEASGYLTRTQSASGSLFRAKEWLKLEDDEPTMTGSIYYLLRNGTDEFTSTYKFTENGISYTTGNPEARDVIVPKRLATQGVTSPSENNSFILDRIVPTLKMGEGYGAALHEITLYNLDFIGTGRIDTDTAGKKIVTVEIRNKKTNEMNIQDVDVTNWVSGRSLSIRNLEEDTTYELKFKAKVNGMEIYLLDGTKNSNVVMSRDVKTKGTVTISDLNVTYKAESYELKMLQTSYRLDQTSGFTIRYRILDESGQEVLSNQEMIDRKMYPGYEAGTPFSNTMTQTFNLNVGQHGLFSGVKYQLEVSTYLLEDDGSVKDTPGSQKIKSFMIPAPATPIPFTNMTPQYDAATKKIGLNVEFSMADSDYVIMSDYRMKDGASSHYFARVYEQSGSKWLDITDKKREQYDIFQSYTMQMKDLKPDTNYKLVLYAAVDKDMDGKDDGHPDLTGSISSLDEEGFENDKEQYVIWEEVCTTPGENGIAFGEVAIENPNNDPSRLSIAYKGASNLAAIDRADYTVISKDGKVNFSGSLKKENGKEIFTQKASGVKGYYVMDLPLMLEVKTTYRVMISYYQKQDDGYVKLEPSYSTTYLYE